MSLAIRYHAATAYTPDTIGAHPGLDWSKQPLPMRVFPAHRPRIELAPWLPFDPNPFSGGASPAHDVMAPLARLARWLYGGYGITGVVDAQPRPLMLRSAPSAGGLYPAELFLVVRHFADIPPGLYGFDPRAHALVEIRRDAAIAEQLSAACYGSAPVSAAELCVVVSGVFERSRWRYRERAYRRILLDSGHVIGGAGLMAGLCGWTMHATSAFHDQALNALLGIDPHHDDPALQEAALAVLALGQASDAQRPAWLALPSSIASAEAATLIETLHAAGDLPARRPAPRALGDAALDNSTAVTATIRLPESSPVAWSDALWPSLIARRSTRRFSGEGIAWPVLARILNAALRPQACGLGDSVGFDRSVLDVLIVIQDVPGIDPGVYRITEQAALHPIRRGADRTRLGQLCLGQELGHDCAAAVLLCADLPHAVRLRGDRVYRTLHLDAGMIGQRLAVAAVAEGLGSSGIGGFFDHEFLAFLGLDADHAVLYPTLLGVPA